jgi:hypothetical protein
MCKKSSVQNTVCPSPPPPRKNKEPIKRCRKERCRYTCQLKESSAFHQDNREDASKHLGNQQDLPHHRLRNVINVNFVSKTFQGRTL